MALKRDLARVLSHGLLASGVSHAVQSQGFCFKYCIRESCIREVVCCGFCSMAVGEYISVSSQKDSEMADIEKERVEQAKGAPTALFS